ncbi:MAG TPA: hypothetical protein VM802_12980 [Chitinophaga sp.]|uniref:hypothetical protein n=1 Tax=Chitinophaga sp. TaxID=1869181 RepID=UPI002CD43A5D|nr:hypothetical protein [Chitinophaga sp.]HVI45782.1 hypothetical protein [Chitinophaga sp.]
MRVLVLAALLLSASALSAQTVKETYCEVVAHGVGLSGKAKVRVDFGQPTSFWAGVEKMRDKVTGRVKKFNSTIDALNYMGAEGWKIVNSYSVTDDGYVIYHYLFRKEVPASEIRDVAPEDYTPEKV